MTDLQNAIGLIQLAKLEEIKKRKNHILHLYQELLANTPGITFFKPDEGADWIPFRVGLLLDHASDLMDYLKKYEIEPRTFFYPLHRQPALARFGQNNDADFPNAIFGYEHGVCLPTFPTLTDEQVNYVCETIKRFQKGKD
jgi:perosamine synthetase